MLSGTALQEAKHSEFAKFMKGRELTRHISYSEKNHTIVYQLKQLGSTQIHIFRFPGE